MLDELLEKHGLTYDQLTKDELSTVQAWVSAVQGNTITVEKVREYVINMKRSIEQDLTNTKDAPTNFFSLLTLFIPIIGVVRKWYQDQKELMLKARLRDLLILEAYLLTPEQARKQIDESLANIAKGLG